MNATNLYMSTCRLVMQADISNEDSFVELHKLSSLLPYLRQSLTCNVCEKILTNPYTPKPLETSCQHHVCKLCIGGKKLLKPSCSWCKDYETYIENSQIHLIVKCYKKLCSYVKTSSLYNKLPSIISNGNICNLGLTEIIDEALGEVSINDQTNIDLFNNDENSVTFTPVIDPLAINTEDENLSLVANETEERKYVPQFSDFSTIPLVNEEEDENKLENFAENLEYLKDKIDNDVLNDELATDELSNTTLDNNIELCKSVSPLLTVDSSDIAPLLENDNCNDNLDTTASISSQEFYRDTLFLPEEEDVSEENIIPVPVTSINNLSSFEDSKDNMVISLNNSKFSDFNEVVNSIPCNSIYSTSNTKVFSTSNTTSLIPITSTNHILSNHNNDKYELPCNISSSDIPSSICQVPSNSENVKLSNNIFSHSTPVVNSVSLIPPIEQKNVLTNTSSAITCVLNMPPGSILSSTNLTKQQNVCDSLLKNGPALNNISSVYSVMYKDNDSTKITIKRKPPDIENLNKIPIPSLHKAKPKPKPKPKRKGCRCGNATPTPGKLTCCGQRCPCYVEAKACIECQCRGCRNPHRPGGKKVRPVIPQFGNIQIHQVQPVHPRVSVISPPLPANIINPASICTLTQQAPIMTIATAASQTVRSVHTMHAVQAVRGIGPIHGVPGNIHQLINVSGGGRGGAIMDPSTFPSGININSELALKPVNLALSSIPTQLLMNDDKSTSNSTSDNSDVDIDI